MKTDFRIPSQWLLMLNHPGRISKAPVSGRNHGCEFRVSGMGPVLVYLGCHSKVSQASWPPQHMFISHRQSLWSKTHSCDLILPQVKN